MNCVLSLSRNHLGSCFAFVKHSYACYDHEPSITVPATQAAYRTDPKWKKERTISSTYRVLFV